jgi:hypothetical protein
VIGDAHRGDKVKNARDLNRGGNAPRRHFEAHLTRKFQKSASPAQFVIHSLFPLPDCDSDPRSFTNFTVFSTAPQGTASMVQISEVKGNSRDNRTAAHTHIKGLGLNINGEAETQAAGFVGQATAREVRSCFMLFLEVLLTLASPFLHRLAALLST